MQIIKIYWLKYGEECPCKAVVIVLEHKNIMTKHVN